MTDWRPARPGGGGPWTWLAFGAVLVVPVVATLVLLLQLDALSSDDAPASADALGASPSAIATLVPGAGAGTAPAGAAPAAPPAPPASPAPAAPLPAVYTVVQGDTLSAIAQRLGVSAAALAAYNNLADPNALRLGQELRLPPPGYTPPQSQRP